MWRTNVVCSKATPDNIKPDFGQRPENGIESSKSEGCNVLQEHVARSQVANGIPEGEEEAGVLSIDAIASPCQADVGTGKAADNHVRTASKQACWDSASVGPHRRLSEGSLFHTRRQPLDGCELVLHVQDAARLSKDPADGAVECTVAGEEARNRVGRYSHIYRPAPLARPIARGWRVTMEPRLLPPGRRRLQEPGASARDPGCRPRSCRLGKTSPAPRQSSTPLH